MGFEAVGNIIKEREKNGKYKSFNDFINRVNDKDVNKLQLEGLTKAGAFDEFTKDRGKIFKSIPKILQQIKKANDEKDSKQNSLFDGKSSISEEFEFLESNKWTQKEILIEEFKSVGFYISDHPLNEYEEIFNQLNIISYENFFNNQLNEGLVAGTIMAIQEKKSAKGTPYAIIKFSDKKREFELFLFSELLVNNREKLKESESFILTLQKDKATADDTKRRVNLKKLVSLEDLISQPYSKVTIELKDDFNISEIKEILSKSGKTKINLIVKNKNKKAYYSLESDRKFDLKDLKALKAKEYVAKISV